MNLGRPLLANVAEISAEVSNNIKGLADCHPEHDRLQAQCTRNNVGLIS